MPTHNTDRCFGSVTRIFHWLTALLILTAIPLGVIANNMPFDTAEALAAKAQLFSIHKTVGVAAFFVALARIFWALRESHPVPLHPERLAEVRLAQTVHWLLYISLVAVPLSGWVHHAAVTGFAPILWPLGQGLPFVPQSEMVAAVAGSLHWLFTKVLVVSILLHVAGALQLHLVDRDSTLRRMTRGVPAPMDPKRPAPSRLPVVAAFALYALGAVLAWSLVPAAETAAAAQSNPSTSTSTPTATATATASGGNWQVTEGNLGFAVKQMGQDVSGRFANWTADIRFDETPTDGKNGQVTVTIDTGSLSLGSVSDQAKGKDFFDVASFPQAVFIADIRPADSGYEAKGTLSLRGIETEVTLPFTLQITDDIALMSGSTTLDRRSFGMGAAYPDEASIGFGVTITVDLTAQRSR
jgi:cytochrome b561/polyisoprenoid-binding protein YceI